MTPWLVHGLRKLGLDIICLDARHARAALKMQINKNDQNDAEGLAQIVRTRWYRSVDLWVAARRHASSALRSESRGFVGRPLRRCADCQTDACRLAPTARASRFLRQGCATCRLLMSVPGIGVFVRPRICQHRGRAGTICQGAVRRRAPRAYAPTISIRRKWIVVVGSRCGDALTRTLMYEAAGVILSRVKKTSSLSDWARAIAKRSGTGKARVALARKLTVILHSTWRSGEPFRWSEQSVTA